MKSALQIEKILKEMIKTENTANKIITEGVERASQIIINANIEAENKIKQAISKAKIEAENIVNEAKSSSENNKNIEIEKIITKNNDILEKASKNKEKAFEAIIEWLHQKQK